VLEVGQARVVSGRRTGFACNDRARLLGSMKGSQNFCLKYEGMRGIDRTLEPSDSYLLYVDDIDTVVSLKLFERKDIGENGAFAGECGCGCKGGLELSAPGYKT
jgi:hypothetical protein